MSVEESELGRGKHLEIEEVKGMNEEGSDWRRRVDTERL